MKLEFSLGEIDKAIKQIESYRQNLSNKTRELTERLATLGAMNVSLEFSRAIAQENDVKVDVEWISSDTMVIRASGNEVAFIEFGAGIKYGAGHPQNSEFGTGPGTYPNGKGHWDNPKGWFYLDENGTLQHTYGNPPNMPMYNTARMLEQEVERIAKEVFSS